MTNNSIELYQELCVSLYAEIRLCALALATIDTIQDTHILL